MDLLPRGGLFAPNDGPARRPPEANHYYSANAKQTLAPAPVSMMW